MGMRWRCCPGPGAPPAHPADGREMHAWPRLGGGSRQRQPAACEERGRGEGGGCWWQGTRAALAGLQACMLKQAWRHLAAMRAARGTGQRGAWLLGTAAGACEQGDQARGERLVAGSDNNRDDRRADTATRR